MSAERPPLRVGLLIDRWIVPRWVDEVVRSVLQSPSTEIALVIVNGSSSKGGSTGRIASLWRNRREWLFNLYRRLDARVFACDDDPFARRDLRDLLSEVPHLTVEPIRSRHSDRFGDAELAEIATHRLDVAVRLGFRILRGPVLEIARHGIWSFHHGDNRLQRGGPAGTWEVFDDSPTTGATLQVLTEDLDAGTVLSRVGIATDPRSVHRNRCALYERAWPMLPRALNLLHRTGRVDPEPPALAFDRGLRRAPSNLEAARAMIRLALRFIADRARSAVTSEQWQLALHIGPESPATFRFKAIAPPRDRLWADPFPVEVDGEHLVFFEELIYPRGKDRPRGWISAFRVDRGGNVGASARVLEAPHHLSYPLVFSWRNDWYMLPESAEARQVTLYRSTNFPDAWEPCAVLVDDVPGLDNTLAEIDGRWWLWVTPRLKGRSPANETLLFHAESPLGPFAPHPQNPVATDVRSARGAGRLFQHDGHWIRPAQDGSGSYGRAILFMRIDRLDLDGYLESEVGRIEPHWQRSIVATHTYNRAGKLQVIDQVKRRSRLGWVAR